LKTILRTPLVCPVNVRINAPVETLQNLIVPSDEPEANNGADASYDKDRDGISNVYECQAGLNATDASDAALDKDGDGMSNVYEYLHSLTATDASDAALDKDGDGLTNLEEFDLSLDATDPDSDGDGLADGLEVKIYGTDPLNPDSDDDGLPDGLEVRSPAIPFLPVWTHLEFI